MKFPTIAAIIPLFNGADYIEHCLKSVLEQTRPVDQIIVIDDGSSDNGAEIARHLVGDDPRFILLPKKNGGQSSARNFGVRHSDCDLIAFLDQDDWWYPTHIEKLSQPFSAERRPKLGWVYSDLDEYDGSGRLITHRMLREHPSTHPKLNVFDCIRSDMMVVPSASLVSREAFDAVNGFDERLSGYEDDDFFLRVFSSGFINLFVDTPLSAWRIHLSSSSYSDQMARSGLIYACKLLDQWPDDERRKRYLGRDLIAPRFAPVAKRAYFASARNDDYADFKVTLAAIKRIRAVLRSPARTKWSLLMPLLRNYNLARLAARSPLPKLMDT